MPMHRAHVAAPAACALPGRIMSSTSRTNGPVPRTNIASLKPIVGAVFSRSLVCRLGICGKRSECDCVLARISSRSFERLNGDDQNIVRALWALTGVPAAATNILRSIDSEQKLRVAYRAMQPISISRLPKKTTTNVSGRWTVGIGGRAQM
ncbi:hypothetical protein R3P38DRAFT_3184922 [Favolaschia claudopus]|uniref:Uncharacterized protein n=1 Tax=Favolaschia claudopus TaxID=2862362 RepID=A0AAW0C600_9AGAR